MCSSDLVAEGINEIDSSGEAMLRQVTGELRRQKIPFALARVKWPVGEVLRRSGLEALIGADRIYPTAEAAMEGLRALVGAPAAGGEAPANGATGKGMA